MSTIVRGRVPASEFALAETLSSVPDMELEVDRIVETADDRVMPLLWVRGADPTTVSTVIKDDPSVQNVEQLSIFEDGEHQEQLYRMEWVSEIELVLQVLTTPEATIREAYGEGESWFLQMFYPTRDTLTETIDYCKDNDLTFDIESIHEMEGNPSGRYGLSEVQHRALTAAAEAGYYHVPRDTTLQELAADLDVSHQALSERLRRAIDTLLAETVLVGPPSDE